MRRPSSSVEAELPARADRRCQALRIVYGAGPIPACTSLAERGETKRFYRDRQAVRAAVRDAQTRSCCRSREPAAGG